MKLFRCGDVVPGCAATFRAAEEDEILRAVGDHAVRDHGVEPDEAYQRNRALTGKGMEFEGNAARARALGESAGAAGRGGRTGWVGAVEPDEFHQRNRALTGKGMEFEGNAARARALGATRTLLAGDADALATVHADVSVESSGSAAGLSTAVTSTARGGRVVMVGLLPPGPQPVPVATAIARSSCAGSATVMRIGMPLGLTIASGASTATSSCS